MSRRRAVTGPFGGVAGSLLAGVVKLPSPAPDVACSTPARSSACAVGAAREVTSKRLAKGKKRVETCMVGG